MIDSSAALAILLGEAEDEAFADAIDADTTRIMSAVSVLETSIVVEARKGPAGGRELDLFLHRGRIDVVAFDAHRAALNFGDCCVYALAAATGEPLLFKGGDFAATDISRVI